ncbi:MAG TPA: hypothetical protein PKK06_04515 [Phycisphaerae bacterium]|nr:hypothetical protein [Phycisphaerae bacterium]HNU46147.1 hypothetical protein [Phycisphaerae bacterium]
MTTEPKQAKAPPAAVAAVSDPEQVLGWLREQGAGYEQLETLARRQRAVLNAADPEPLLALLAERQKLTAHLTVLAERLQPARRQWAQYQQCLAPAQAEEAECLLRVMGERLDRVLASDAEDARVLAARKAAVASGLRQSQTVNAALNAYQTAPHPAGRLDQTHNEA